MHVDICLCVGSKDLFSSSSTQCSLIDRSIRAAVACIRREFQVANVDKMTWIPEKLNIADAVTKKEQRSIRFTSNDTLQKASDPSVRKVCRIKVLN